MGVAERKLRQKEEVKSKILLAAWDVVRSEGWQALSIRKIAEAIEYSVPVVYDHFENKEAILFEISSNGFALLLKKLREVEKKYSQPEALLKEVANAYWNFAFKNKEYYQLMFGLGMPCCNAVKPNNVCNDFQSLIGAAIEKIGTKTNKATPGWVDFKVQVYWSLLHGIISLKIINRAGDKDSFNKKIMEDAVDSFVNNLSRGIPEG